MLLCWVNDHYGIAPSDLRIEDLDTEVIVGFLDHLESERHNTARSRNARLAAIRSLFRYAALRHPDHAALIQRVLPYRKSVSTKPRSVPDRNRGRCRLAAPDTTTWEGRRDVALIALAVQTGLRVSELVNLNCGDVDLGSGGYVMCTGKGRKLRATPLTKPPGQS